MGRPHYIFPFITGSYTLIVDNKRSADHPAKYTPFNVEPSTGKHFSLHGVKHSTVKGFSPQLYLWHDFIYL